MTAMCSLPGCGGEAVLSWQRLGTDVEAQSYADGLTAQMQAFVDAQRVTLALEVEDLQARYQRIVDSGSATAPMLEVVRSQIEMRQADLAALVDAAPVPVEQVAMIVFGCETHAVSADDAAKLHEQGCMSPSGCVCALPADTGS